MRRSSLQRPLFCTARHNGTPLQHACRCSSACTVTALLPIAASTHCNGHAASQQPRTDPVTSSQTLLPMANRRAAAVSCGSCLQQSAPSAVEQKSQLSARLPACRAAAAPAFRRAQACTAAAPARERDEHALHTYVARVCGGSTCARTFCLDVPVAELWWLGRGSSRNAERVA